MATVVIPYARSRIAYSAVKSLFRAGHNIVAADSTSLAMCRLSKYIDDFEMHPDPHSSTREFIIWAVKQHERGRLIFPTFMEVWKLSGILPIPMPPLKTIMRANDKLQVHLLCKELGIPTPWSQYLERGVLKPLDKRGAKDRMYFDKMLVQERVEGDAIGVGMLFNKGKLRAKFCWRRIEEYPKDGGMSVIRESCRAPEQEVNAQRLAEALEWHGSLMIEFLGKYVLEVNPRLWGSVSLAIESGVDFPKLIVDIMEKGDCDEVTEWKLGVKCSWLAGCLLRRCRPQGITEDWSLGDPLPFFGQFMLPLWNMVRGNGMKLDIN